jgi:hypothetical protein
MKKVYFFGLLTTLDFGACVKNQPLPAADLNKQLLCAEPDRVDEPV